MFNQLNSLFTPCICVATGLSEIQELPATRMSKELRISPKNTPMSNSSSPPAKRQKITVEPFAAAFPRRTLLSSSRWVNLPEDIWVHQILNPFLDLKVLATVGRCNTFFEEYWQYVLKQNVIRVPEGCPTMNQAMEVAVIFSERNECKRENPIRVEVGEGESHAEIVLVVLRRQPFAPSSTKKQAQKFQKNVVRKGARRKIG